MGNGDRNSIIECGKKEVSHRRKMQPKLPFPLRSIPNWQLLPVRNIADKVNVVNSRDFVPLTLKGFCLIEKHDFPRCYFEHYAL